MAVRIRTSLSSILTRRVLMIGLLFMLALGIIAVVVWSRMEHVIAPPPLRLMNWLRSVFV